MSVSIEKMNKIIALSLIAGGLGLVSSLGWPLGWVGGLGAGLLAFLHYTTPQIESELRWPGIRRRPLFAVTYAVALALLVSTVLVLLIGH